MTVIINTQNTKQMYHWTIDFQNSSIFNGACHQCYFHFNRILKRIAYMDICSSLKSCHCVNQFDGSSSWTLNQICEICYRLYLSYDTKKECSTHFRIVSIDSILWLRTDSIKKYIHLHEFTSVALIWLMADALLAAIMSIIK